MDAKGYMTSVNVHAAGLKVYYNEQIILYYDYIFGNYTSLFVDFVSDKIWTKQASFTQRVHVNLVKGTNVPINLMFLLSENLLDLYNFKSAYNELEDKYSKIKYFNAESYIYNIESSIKELLSIFKVFTIT